MKNIIYSVIIIFIVFFSTSCSKKEAADASETAEQVRQETEQTGTIRNAETKRDIKSQPDEAIKTGTDKTALQRKDQALERKTPQQNIREVLGSLKNTQHFARHTAEHIFNGSINRKQLATGYHYDPIPDSDGKIIKGTQNTPNAFGVYEAAVTVRGIKKFRKSSFFPDRRTPQEIVDDINHAYMERKPTRNRAEAFYGYAPDGMCIQMFVDSRNGQITSAFPKYENSKCAVY